MDMLIQDLDPQKFKINPSPSSGDFLEDLCHELKFSDSDQAFLDLFGSASQKNDVVYQENCQFDFTAGHLFPERLQEFGMKNDVLSYVKSGIPVQLDSPLYSGDIKPKRNSKNVKNCSVVHNLLGDLEEAGHIERVNYKPLVISPLNLVPKSNGSPRLIHNLKVLNRFVKRGPSVKHLNVLELAKSEFSRETYFCKLDLSNGYFHLSIGPEDRTYFGFSFDNQYFGMYRPISNNIHLVGDNLGVLFCLKRGLSRNLFANEILKYLAYLWLNSPFFLNVLYIKSAVIPADFYTRYF